MRQVVDYCGYSDDGAIKRRALTRTETAGRSPDDPRHARLRYLLNKARTLNVTVILAVLAVAAPGYAATTPLLAADPSRPPMQKFVDAMDLYIEQQGRGFFTRYCVSLNPALVSERTGTFKDTFYDETPAGYRLSTETLNDPRGALRAQLDYLRNEGFLEGKPNAKGGIDYLLTWKGYAASNTNGCLFIHGHQSQSVIDSVEKKLGAEGSVSYEVSAAVVPKNAVPWAKKDSFNQLFPEHAALLQGAKPYFRKYEMALRDNVLQVVKVEGRDYRHSINAYGIEMAKQAGTITADRVKTAIQSYIDTSLGAGSRDSLCLRLPPRNEVDQVVAESPRVGDRNIAPAALEFYHLPYRFTEDLALKWRGYTWLRRLETLDLVKANRLLDATEFGGQIAVGGSRFELTRDGTAWFAQDLQGCRPLATYKLEEILDFDQPDPRGGTMRFIARLSITPVDEPAKRVINEFGHYARVLAAGVPLAGQMFFKEGRLQVTSAQVKLPKFLPASTEPAIPAYPQNIEVHAVSVNKGLTPLDSSRPGAGPSPEGRVQVTVFPTAKPVGLFLTASAPVLWVVEAKPGARLARVITSGNSPQRVEYAKAKGIAVSTVPDTGISASSGAERAFGIKPKSNQYLDTGIFFEVGLP